MLNVILVLKVVKCRVSVDVDIFAGSARMLLILVLKVVKCNVNVM